MRAKILGDTPRGSCPACLVETALGLIEEASVAGSMTPADRIIPTSRDYSALGTNLDQTSAITNYSKKSVAAAKAWFIGHGRKVLIVPLYLKVSGWDTGQRKRT
jgi:hypothetical protein